MTVILKTVLCGPCGSFQPGEHTFDDAMERDLVRGGYAEYARRPAAAPAPVPHEVAVLTAPEVRAPVIQQPQPSRSGSKHRR